MSTIVFLGAPSASDIHKNAEEYHWRTVSSKSWLEATVYPPATLEAASRRISLLYDNVIFNEDDEPDADDDGTFITWPPTGAPGDDSSGDSLEQDRSFLNITSKSMAESQFETTQESQSYNYSDASSIARFPTFHFSLNALTSLTSLTKSRAKGTKKVSLLLAALEIDGPDMITLKTGRDAGKECCVLRMILGDEDGNVCKLTAWREVAMDWGGLGMGAGREGGVGARRGDIMLLTDVQAAFEPGSTVTLTASPWQKPKLTICYRTMPYANTREDQRLRPDLRLGASDACVRRVASVVRWLEGMAGLA